jgi:hypothetical protein
MAQFKSAFFAFPSEPAELRNPIATAVELVKSNPSLSLQAWPHLQIFGAAISDEVRGGIERANVLVCDITKPNLNVYYETGYSIGLGKSLAPVLNASFANATADIIAPLVKPQTLKQKARNSSVIERGLHRTMVVHNQPEGLLDHDKI